MSWLTMTFWKVYVCVYVYLPAILHSTYYCGRSLRRHRVAISLVENMLALTYRYAFRLEEQFSDDINR